MDGWMDEWMNRELILPLLQRFFIVSLWLCALGQNASAADWPQFLGPTRDGVYGGKSLDFAWPKEGPVRIWRTSIGSGFSGPVVASGKLIIFHRQGSKEIVEAYEARTGKRLWISEYPTTYTDDFGKGDGPRSTPAISAGRVYTFGAEGALTCWEMENGRKVWAVDTKSSFQAGKGFFGMACSPLIEGKLVLLNLGGMRGAGIVAFDAENGRLKWKATEHEASYSSPIVSTIAGTPYGFFFTREGLVALNPTNGTVYCDFPWRSRSAASVNAATPLVISNLVFISASYQTGAALLALHNDRFEKIWSGDDILSNHYATSVHHQGFLYGFEGRQEYGAKLRCVELKTGRVRWTLEPFGSGTLSLVGSDLLLLTEKGELVRAAASPAGYVEKGRAQILSGEVRAYPALADGFYYARDRKELICLQLEKQK